MKLKKFLWKINDGQIYKNGDFISFLDVSDGIIETEKVKIEGNKNYILSFKFRVALEVFLKKYRDDYLSKFLKNHPFYWKYGVKEAFLKIVFYDREKQLGEVSYPVSATSTFFYWDFVKFKRDLSKGWVDSFIKIKTPKNSEFLKIFLKIKSKNIVKGGFGIGDIEIFEKEKSKETYGKISIRTYDENGNLTPSKISIFSFYEKKFIIPPFEIYSEHPFPFFFNIDGETEFLLKEGRYTIDASKGFSYSVERCSFYLPAGSERNVEFKFKKKIKNNYISSDHHVHLFVHFNTHYPFINDEVFKKICSAEGLDFVMWGINNVEWKGEKIENKVLIEKGLEIASQRYGHFCLVGLKKKLKNFPEPFTEYPPLWKYLKILSKNKTAIIAAHPCQTIKVGEDIVKEDDEILNYVGDINRWNLNKILPLVLLMKIPCGFDVIIADGSGSFYVFLREYFRLLNYGFKVNACGSTDSNVDMKNSFNPVGSARTYLYVKEKNIENIASSYIKGNTFATNGPLIFPEYKDFIIGDEIVFEKEKEIEMSFYVYSSFGLSFVEVYYNGEVINRFDISGHKEAEKKFKLYIDRSGWINFIVRGPGNKWVNSFILPEDERIYLGQICVTTPFYIKLKNKPYKAPEDLCNYYLTYLENFKSLVEKLSIKDTEKQEIINEINFYKKEIKSGKVEIL